jgi:hypothetical protein
MDNGTFASLFKNPPQERPQSQKAPESVMPPATPDMDGDTDNVPMNIAPPMTKAEAAPMIPMQKTKPAPKAESKAPAHRSTKSEGGKKVVKVAKKVSAKKAKKVVKKAPKKAKKVMKKKVAKKAKPVKKTAKKAMKKAAKKPAKKMKAMKKAKGKKRA